MKILPYYLLLLLSIYASILWANEPPLSDSVRITLLTCSPGAELYSSFGHSAVRVQDFKQQFDFVFNYGVFDFTRPGFYLNFCRGHMIYMLAVDDYTSFAAQYQYNNRAIVEQEFILSDRDKHLLFNFLVDNASESKRDYRYDFLFDNCSTRIRELFRKVYGDRFQIDYSTFTAQKSFRDLINDYSMDKLWWQWGMGVLIGLPVDHHTTPQEQTFLPDYLSRAFAHATLDGHPLCTPAVTILPRQPAASSAALFTPTVVFAIAFLLILLLTMFEFRRGKPFLALDYVLLFASGLMGLLLALLWGGTEHTTTPWNLNLLWALPTHIIAIFMLWFGKRWVGTIYYFRIAALLAAIMALGWWLLPQQVLIANIFIAAILALRCAAIGWHWLKA